MTDAPTPAPGSAPASAPGTEAAVPPAVVSAAPAAALDPALLSILVCPLLRCPLRLEGDELVATQPEGAGLRYPVRDGIPVLLIDEATLPDGVASLDEFKQKHADQIPAG